MKATGKTNIGELIAGYPPTAAVMARRGLHCVGCFANPFDTIEAGCRIHGMNDSQIAELLDEVNDVIRQAEKQSKRGNAANNLNPNASFFGPANGQPVFLTPSAATQIELAMREKGKAGWLLRVAIEKDGCPIHAYFMEFENPKEKQANKQKKKASKGKPAERPNEGKQKELPKTDEEFVSSGVKVVVARKLLDKIGGTTVDYSPQGGFVMRNPRPAVACTCGKKA